MVIDTRGTEVADAACFAEQARKERSQRGRLGEEMNRAAERRTSQVSADEVSSDTHRNILELEGAIAALRADHSIRIQGGDNASQNTI